MHCHVENHAVEGMGVVLNEAQPNQNPSPPDMRQCGNFGPTLAEFYDWLQFDPNNPITGSPPTIPLPEPSTCVAAGFTRGCCNEPDNKCYISAGKCWCDAQCHSNGNCCPDISSIGCAKPPPVTPKPTPPRTCKAAGFSSCCRRSGRGCYVSTGRCWCDSACRRYRNCCPDIGTTCPRSGWGGWGNEEAEEVQNQLDQANNGPARSQATGCAAAGYNGCCTGDDCKTESGCYCDVKCYYFHNCCDDITSIGCYPPQRRELFFMD